MGSHKKVFFSEQSTKAFSRPPPPSASKERLQISLVDNTLPPPLLVDCPLKKRAFYAASLQYILMFKSKLVPPCRFLGVGICKASSFSIVHFQQNLSSPQFRMVLLGKIHLSFSRIFSKSNF